MGADNPLGLDLASPTLDIEAWLAGGVLGEELATAFMAVQYQFVLEHVVPKIATLAAYGQPADDVWRAMMALYRICIDSIEHDTGLSAPQ